MKFVFKKLGPIKEAELELGDLTIIAGRNNTGKTYVAYTLYGFLKKWRGWAPFPEFFAREMQLPLSSEAAPLLPDMKRLAKTLLEKGQVKWSVDRETLHLQRELIMREVTQDFSKEALAGVFNSSDEDFEGASIGVGVENKSPENAPSQTVGLSTGEELTIAYDGGELCLSRSNVGRRYPPDADISLILADLYFSFLFSEFPDPFILCAERFGISLFYKELDFTKNRLVDTLQEVGKNRDHRLLPFLIIDELAGRYPLPIKDNIDYTRDIPHLRRLRSEVYDSGLFKNIRDMLGGYYRGSGDDIRFISKARKARHFDIPLYIASSSVRGLSDLYFFLRHAASKNQLLIIDEPESHLDTANQIQFARLLAHAVHAGLKVLITTHSDYIVKEINNLLMLSAPFEEKDEVLKELGYSKHDFLKPDSVRAYVAEKNTLTRCTIEKYGIDMPVFDTTIDAINRVSSELSVRLKYEGDE